MAVLLAWEEQLPAAAAAAAAGEAKAAGEAEAEEENQPPTEEPSKPPQEAAQGARGEVAGEEEESPEQQQAEGVKQRRRWSHPAEQEQRETPEPEAGSGQRRREETPITRQPPDLAPQQELKGVGARLRRGEQPERLEEEREEHALVRKPWVLPAEHPGLLFVDHRQPDPVHEIGAAGHPYREIEPFVVQGREHVPVRHPAVSTKTPGADPVWPSSAASDARASFPPTTRPQQLAGQAPLAAVDYPPVASPGALLGDASHVIEGLWASGNLGGSLRYYRSYDLLYRPYRPTANTNTTGTRWLVRDAVDPVYQRVKFICHGLAGSFPRHTVLLCHCVNHV